MSLNYLVTMADATRYLQSQGYDFDSDINFEKNIEQYRASAHKRICGYLGYEILSNSYTDELYTGSGKEILYLKNRPITALNGLTYNGSSYNTDNYSISSDATFIYNEDGIFFSPNYFWKVSYTAGYTSTTMPADIRQAGLQLIAMYYKQGGPMGTLGLTSQSSPDASSQSYDLEAEDSILNAISHYRKVTI